MAFLEKMVLLIMFCKIWFSSFSFLCLEILSKMYRNLERDKIRWVPKVLEVILMREGLCKSLIQQFVSFVHWKYKILLPTFIFSQFFTQLIFVIIGPNTILSNIELTWLPYFWVQTNGHRISNLIGPPLDLPNYSLNRQEHRFYEHRPDLNVFIFW